MRFSLLFFLVLLWSSCNNPPTNNRNIPMKLLWSIPYEFVGIDITTSPFILGDSLVIMSAGREVFAVEQETGDIRWKAFVDELTDLQSAIFTADDERIFATHVEDVRAWYIETGGLAWLTPLPEDRGGFGDDDMAHTDGRIFVGGRKHAYCLDSNSGEIIWSTKMPHTVVDCAVKDDIAYFGLSWNNSTPTDLNSQVGMLYALNVSNGDSIWSTFINDSIGGILMAPMIEGNIVYIGNAWEGPSGFQAFDALTGEEIWHYFTPNSTYNYEHAMIVDDLIIINSGWYWVTALNKHTGELVWRRFIIENALNGRIHYYSGYVYHPHGGRLYVLDPQSGDIVYDMNGPNSESIYTIAVGNGKVFVCGWPNLMTFEVYDPEDNPE